jgi:DNA-binding GntR family transcriptional regulator
LQEKCLTLVVALLRIKLHPQQPNLLKGVNKVATKLNVRVNRKRPESMTRQIREQLDALIDAGTLAAGTLLPSERELANTLNVARNVVRGAYEQLMEVGKLRSEGRRGRSVSRGGSGGGTAKKRSTKSSTKTSKSSKTKARKK